MELQILDAGRHHGGHARLGVDPLGGVPGLDQPVTAGVGEAGEGDGAPGGPPDGPALQAVVAAGRLEGGEVEGGPAVTAAGLGGRGEDVLRWNVCGGPLPVGLHRLVDRHSEHGPLHGCPLVICQANIY